MFRERPVPVGVEMHLVGRIEGGERADVDEARAGAGGGLDPYRLFLVFDALVDAERRLGEGFRLAHMLDQSHNVTDPIESLMTSAVAVQRACVQALLVDREALAGHQAENDALMARTTLERAFRTDVDPILREARVRAGGADDPVASYRATGYRAAVAKERPASAGGGGGIV